MDKGRKSSRYTRLLEQIKTLLEGNDDILAQMATVSAVLFNKMDHFFWCGFYRMVDGELIVGPYQGPLACQRLKKNTGVCWTSVNQKKTIVVPDVHLFPGHIACDARSRSEIVIPLINDSGNVIAVLDIDSKELSAFDDTDKLYLEKIVMLMNTSNMSKLLSQSPCDISE